MAGSLDLKRVLLCDNVDSCCKDILEANNIAVDVKNKLTKEELLTEIKVLLYILITNISFLAFSLINWIDFDFIRRTMMV